MRTPLSVIQSSAQILELLNGAERITKELLTLHTNRIVNEVGGMENLMEELLLVSKIESGKVEYKPFPQNLSSFIKTLLFERYSPYNDGRYMRFEERGERRELAFDRVMMQHILNNIINNAFKYSSGKRPPLIRVRYGINKLSIIVMDFGIGIPEKDRQNLFKAFSRASNVDGIKGTGLGLLVVKYFLDFHQAKLRFKTKINTGTCIIIDMIDNPA
jgi:K+-sensing histidine kinase KdpD